MVIACPGVRLRLLGLIRPPGYSKCLMIGRRRRCRRSFPRVNRYFDIHAGIGVQKYGEASICHYPALASK